MSNIEQNQNDVFMRWDWLWSLLFYGTVILSLVFFIFEDDQSASIWIAGGLTLGMVVWHGFGIRWAFQGLDSWENRAWQRFFIIVGDIVFWFLLVSISSVFYFALFGLFSMVFRNLPIRFAMMAVVLLMSALIYQQLADAGEAFSLTSPYVWTFVFMGIGSVLLGSWISAIIEQSRQRQQLIEELESTQAELSEVKRREGALEERQRLAGEIHDTLAQGFTSIVMLLETAEQALPKMEDNTVSNQLQLARDTARSSLEQARRLVWELRPEPLEHASLPDALQRVCTSMENRSDIKTTLVTTGQPIGLHPEIEIAILRALQEALHNIEKHADSSLANITLSYMSDVVVLDVTDDGVGFDVEKPKSADSYGLIGMRQRVEKLGGRVLIESEINQGTALVVEIPIREIA